MLLLDTNHFSEWERDSAAGRRFRARLEKSKPDMAVAVVTVEEQMRGWLAEINRQHDPHRQISAYAKLQRAVEVFADWTVLPWDAEAAELFLDFRRRSVRVGTMDLRIACIALAHDAMLLTRNASDFALVPGLRVENWLD